MKKHIAVAAGLYPPDIGGPATYARMIEAELPKRDIEVTIVPFGSVRGLPKVLRHFVYMWRLWRASKGTHAIYALDSISVGIPALVVSSVRRVPLIVRLGGDYAWEQGRQRFGVTDTLDVYATTPRRRYAFPVRFLAWLQDMVVAHATRVIVPSQYLKGIVTTWRGVSSKKVVVVYSALFPLVVETPKATLREQLSYRKFTIVSAGRLVPWKGFSVLLQTVARVKGDMDIELVIAGDGSERSALEALSKQLGLKGEVRFVGALSKDALGAVIKAADLFVLNTGYEGLSHQLLEVMDLEVPIVTTDVGGNPELITDRLEGILVPYNDSEALAAAIIRIAKDTDLAEQLTTRAHEKTKQFAQGVVLDSLVVELNQVI